MSIYKGHLGQTSFLEVWVDTQMDDKVITTDHLEFYSTKLKITEINTLQSLCNFR